MAFIAVATGGAALAGLGGALINSSATRDAAAQQAEAARYAAEIQQQIYNQQRQDQTPWREAGMRALTGMENADFSRDFQARDFKADPGYAFRLAEAQKAMERSAAAKGSLQSGGFMKGLTRYSQDAASQEYGNAYNRFNADRDRRFGRLSQLAGFGTNANQMNAQAGQNYANQVGNIGMNNANAQGAAGIAQANAWSGAFNNAGNQASNYFLYSKMFPAKEKAPGEV